MKSKFFDWFHKRGVPASSPYLVELRKLLGMAQENADRGLAVSRLRARTSDGKALMDVGVYNGIPFATVTATDGSSDREVCEGYMVSGMFDLGTPTENTEATAGRFKEFGDDVPTLLFGDTVDCEAAAKGVSGTTGGSKVTHQPSNVVDFSLRWSCGPDPDVAVTQEAPIPESDPPATFSIGEKKQAQWHIPASMCTGLMRAYVQSLYGNPTAVYGATDDGLNLIVQAFHADGSHFLHAPWGGTTVVHFGGFDLRLCVTEIDSGTLTQTLYRLRLSLCGELFFLRYTADTTNTRMLAAALHDAKPDDENGIQIISGAWAYGDPISPYGFCADSTGREAVAVCLGSDAQWRLLKRTFTKVGGVVDAAFEVLQSGTEPAKAGWTFDVLYPSLNPFSANEQVAMLSLADSAVLGNAETGVTYEAPVAAFYDHTDQLVVATLKHSLAVEDAAVPEIPGSLYSSLCGDFNGNVELLCDRPAAPALYYVTSGIEVKVAGVIAHSTVQVGMGFNSSGVGLSRTGSFSATSRTTPTDVLSSVTRTAAQIQLGQGLGGVSTYTGCERTEIPAPTWCYGSHHDPSTGTNNNPCSAFDYDSGTCEYRYFTPDRIFTGTGVNAYLDVTNYGGEWHNYGEGRGIEQYINSTLVLPYGDAAAFVVRSSRYDRFTNTKTASASRSSFGRYDVQQTALVGATVTLDCVVTFGGCSGDPPLAFTVDVTDECVVPTSSIYTNLTSVSDTDSASFSGDASPVQQYAAVLFSTWLEAESIDSDTGTYADETTTGTLGFSTPACLAAPPYTSPGSSSPILIIEYDGDPGTLFQFDEQNWPHGHFGVPRVVTSISGATIYHNDWISGRPSVDNNRETFTHNYEPASYYSFVGHA